MSTTLPPESQHLEYKREVTDTLEREVVGFLNHRDGGRILIGVENDGTIVGLRDPDGDQLKIKDRLKLQEKLAGKTVEKVRRKVRRKSSGFSMIILQ